MKSERILISVDQRSGRSEFKISEVLRERDRDTAEEKTQNKEKATRGRVGDFLSRIAKVEEKKYHIGISEVWRPKGGEDIDFELWHI